jgi:hypothetical protein
MHLLNMKKAGAETPAFPGKELYDNDKDRNLQMIKYYLLPLIYNFLDLPDGQLKLFS